jgi:hypothetical protein
LNPGFRWRALFFSPEAQRFSSAILPVSNLHDLKGFTWESLCLLYRVFSKNCPWRHRKRQFWQNRAQPAHTPAGLFAQAHLLVQPCTALRHLKIHLIFVFCASRKTANKQAVRAEW